MELFDVFFPGKAGRLEGLLWLPPGGGRPVRAVVLCHPHPLYGGNMGNHVLQQIGGRLVESGLAAFFFNFRGVRGSAGSFDDGRGEQEDLRAAVNYIQGREDIGAPLGLLGYSFGGLVALSAGPAMDEIGPLAAISPLVPAVVPDEWTKPKLFILGGNDQVIATNESVERIGRWPDPKEIVVQPGADHFWTGAEGELTDAVANFFRRHLAPRSSHPCHQGGTAEDER